MERNGHGDDWSVGRKAVRTVLATGFVAYMGWRWRKTIRGGPFRWNLSKGGVGWSVGIPGLRYGRTAYGTPYISIGIPGTGLYWIKYLRRPSDPADRAWTARPPLPPPSGTPPLPPQVPTARTENEKLLTWQHGP